MILSVSRRTDIPAFYSDWFYKRVKEGFVYSRNPMNQLQVSNIPINTEITDGIVFWTKNPANMLSRLKELEKFNYYFQFTLNAYSSAIEFHVPRKLQRLNTFKKLSDLIGPECVIWRYDPILLSDDIDVCYHLKHFEQTAKDLSGYARSCVISFIDMYKKTGINMKSTDARVLTIDEVNIIAKEFSGIAKTNNFNLQTCAEEYDLKKFRIEAGRCINHVLFEQMTGKTIKFTKDKNQRELCGCIESIDIGEYNTCLHNCLYCYANQTKVVQKSINHQPNLPLLIGEIKERDVVKDRKIKSISFHQEERNNYQNPR